VSIPDRVTYLDVPPLPVCLSLTHAHPPSHQLKHCGVARLLHIYILFQLQGPSCPTARTVQPPRYSAVACIPLQVRFFGSPRDAGSGQLKSLVAAIKAGSIDEVYLLTRWNGHGTTQQVRKLCRLRPLLFFWVTRGARTPTGWPHTAQSGEPDCRGPEAKGSPAR
jgi:hypothetical protein